MANPSSIYQCSRGVLGIATFFPPISSQNVKEKLYLFVKNTASSSKSTQRARLPCEMTAIPFLSGVTAQPKIEAFSPDSWEFWWRIVAIVALLLLAGVMAGIRRSVIDDATGLTTGLMALDINNIEILKRCGRPQQQRYARAIEPIRRNGHLLLCTLLVGNMLANEAIPVLMDDVLEGGWLVVAVSTLLVVIFAEIIPQGSRLPSRLSCSDLHPPRTSDRSGVGVVCAHSHGAAVPAYMADIQDFNDEFGQT
jgi:hypothetical protein